MDRSAARTTPPDAARENEGANAAPSRGTVQLHVSIQRPIYFLKRERNSLLCAAGADASLPPASQTSVKLHTTRPDFGWQLSGPGRTQVRSITLDHLRAHTSVHIFPLGKMSSPAAKARSRAWCFTYNSTPEHLLLLPAWQPEFLQALPDDVYVVCQLERAPATGQLHIQGYIHFPQPKTMSGVKKFCSNEQLHLEKPGGSPAQNKTYCTKEDTRVDGTEPFEHGELPQQGKRTDIATFVSELTASSGSLDASNPEHLQHVLLRPSGVRALQQLLAVPARPASTPPQVFVLWGAPGTGKSRAVRDFAAGHGLALHVFLPANHGKLWFDGYTNQPVALYDDFQDDIPYPLLLRMLDRYETSPDFGEGSLPSRVTRPNFACHLQIPYERRGQGQLRRLRTALHFPHLQQLSDRLVQVDVPAVACFRRSSHLPPHYPLCGST